MKPLKPIEKIVRDGILSEKEIRLPGKTYFSERRKSHQKGKLSAFWMRTN